MNTTVTIMPVSLLQRWFITFQQPVRRGPWRRWRRTLAIGYCLLAALGLYGYFAGLSAPLVIGALAIFYTPACDTGRAPGFRFGWPALFFTALFFVAPVRTVVYAALVCGSCCYRETFYRRVPATTLFILALQTPVASYFADTFSFPIRLHLTALAARFIALTGCPVAVDGNTITFREHMFSVDPACMGLNMLVISLLTALLLMNYYQRQKQFHLPVSMIAGLLLFTIGLNILANLLRIVSLVVLLILPDNPLHGIFGLLLMVVYVLVPLLPMIRYIMHRFGHPVQNAKDTPSPLRSRWVLAGNGLVTAALFVVIPLCAFKKDPPQPHLSRDLVPGYTLTQLPEAILKLDNPKSLVYIKPIPGFYYTDHTPAICWKGSGYTFTSLEESAFAGVRVFEATLEKGPEKLYTAWWYDNGSRQTIIPWEWRWDLIRGGPAYAVVNVTAASPAALKAEVARILKTHPFKRLLVHS